MSKNSIHIDNPVIRDNTIIYKYSVEGEWKEYFTDTIMSVEYEFSLDNIPISILLIPLIGNILPMIWLLDAELYVEKLDSDFLTHIDDIKEGFQIMYPSLEFRGQIFAHPEDNNYQQNKNKRGLFFSGGVDAYTSLLRNIDYNPELMTIWGADIKLTDVDGWDNVRKSVDKVAKEYGLVANYIRSNFRSMIYEEKLNEIVKKSGDQWWHGLQSGVAIISHAAPIAFYKGYLEVYIASSFPEKMKGLYTCGSDPLIDENIHFAGCKTIHDGYELDRQEKVRYIVNSKKEDNRPVTLRVCWISSGGSNCCKCEKCYRTVLELVSEGANPNEYGFEWKERNIKRCRRDMLYKLQGKNFDIQQFYPPIQDSLRKNYNLIDDSDKYKWLLSINFDNYNNYIIKKIYNLSILKLIRRAVGKVKRWIG